MDDAEPKPAIPELMGNMEVSELFGVTRQRVYTLRKTLLWRRHVPNVQELRSGPVFLAEEVHAFQAAWTREPGRPKKETS